MRSQLRRGRDLLGVLKWYAASRAVISGLRQADYVWLMGEAVKAMQCGGCGTLAVSKGLCVKHGEAVRSYAVWRAAARWL